MKVTLKEALAAIANARICVIVTKTRPKLLKKSRTTGEPCPYREVERLAERRVMIGCQYENAVNNQLDREGSQEKFQAESLWNGKGEHVPGNRFLVRHKDSGKEYLAFMPLASATDRWICPETGADVEAESLADYLPLERPATNQGTEKAISWRVVEASNVVQIRAGEFYDIVSEAAEGVAA